MATVYLLFALVICGAIGLQAQSWCSDKCTFCFIGCEHCVDGYYPSGSDCLQCNSLNCRTCETDGLCTSCKSGFFGSTCANACGIGCINGTCDFDTGVCQCLDGYYTLYCYACSDKCQDVCDKTSGVCRCSPGFRGVNCNIKCWSPCAECTNSTSCSLCPAGKYGATCNMDCTTKCSNGACDIHTGHCKESCPVNCQNCIDKNNCTSCYSGFYGTTCEQPCPINCELGCYINTGECYSCDIGWYGEKCNKSCSTNCRNGCEKFSGKCPECYPGYYGDNCELKCLECNGECVKENGSCTECYPGRYGPYCEHTCPSYCLGNLCNRTNGYCYDCIQGYTGGICNVSLCPANCLSCNGFKCNTTDRTCTNEGVCINGCVTDYIGLSCDRKCPTHCVPVLNGSRCSSDGVCTNGCTLNYYGSWCENACPANCVSVAIGNRCAVNGTCRGGCILEYSGETCEQRAESFTPDDSKSASTAGIVAGSFFGGVTLTVACVVVALVVRAKRKKQPNAYAYYNTQTVGAGNISTNPDQTRSDAESN